jgi:hypothetical protein
MAVIDATNFPLYELDGSLTKLTQPPPGNYTNRTPAGVTYSVYTGLVTGAGGLFQIDTTTANGDLRTFGGAPSAINPYIVMSGTSLNGQTRTVSDSAVPNGLGGFDLTITVTGSGNLFPSGLTSSGNALTTAGVGLGLNLGARGNGALLFPENLVQSATLTLKRASGAPSPFSIPPGTLGAPGGWNGVVAIGVNNIAIAANEADPYTSVIWNISTIPAPSGTALLALGLFAAARRRR